MCVCVLRAQGCGPGWILTLGTQGPKAVWGKTSSRAAVRSWGQGLEGVLGREEAPGLPVGLQTPWFYWNHLLFAARPPSSAPHLAVGLWEGSVGRGRPRWALAPHPA